MSVYEITEQWQAVRHYHRGLIRNLSAVPLLWGIGIGPQEEHHNRLAENGQIGFTISKSAPTATIDGKLEHTQLWLRAEYLKDDTPVYALVNDYNNDGSIRYDIQAVTPWSGERVYDCQMIVIHHGVLYECVTAHCAGKTFDETYWNKLTDGVKSVTWDGPNKGLRVTYKDGSSTIIEVKYAEKAKCDSNGNIITDTYATKAELATAQSNAENNAENYAEKYVDDLFAALEGYV